MTARHAFISGLMLIVLGISGLSARPAAPTSFSPADDTPFNIGSGFNDSVLELAATSDGTGDLYVGGLFTSFNGLARNRIVRLNPDGSIDGSFDVGGGFNSQVFRFASGPIGSEDLYVGGNFTSYKGTAVNRLVRLNSDGSFDSTFAIGTGFNSSVRALTPAADDDLYAGGAFTSYKGTAANRLVRLNSDGSIDSTFAIGTGFNSIVGVLALALDGSGDVYTGGAFTSYNGTSSNRIIRLNSDGTIDTAFNVGTGFNGEVNAVAPALDGSGDVFACGVFTSFNGTAANRIVRLNSNGSIDTAFDVGAGFNSTALDLALPSADGSGDVYVGGAFTTFGGATRNRVVRLNPNGTLDSAFNVGSGFNSTVRRMILAPDESGNLFVGGDFSIYNGVTRNRIVRLNASGSVDAAVWNIGDVFVAAVYSPFSVLPQTKVYTNAGIIKDDIFPPGLNSLSSGGSFNPDRTKLYTTNGSKVSVFDDASPHQIVQSINTGVQNIGSIVFCASGEFYLGNSTFLPFSSGSEISRFSPEGIFQQRFGVAGEVLGPAHLDLAVDQQTMFYTTFSRRIFRYNVSGSGTQLADFAVLPGSGGATAFRLLPPGDGSGGLIIADVLNIKRLDGSGSVIQIYDASGESRWTTMNLDPNLTSFWAGDSGSGRFYRFNIASGLVEVGPIDTGILNAIPEMGGICVKGEPTAATAQIQPLDANSGPDQIIECTSHAGMAVTLDGSESSDPDGNTLTFEWKNAAGQVIGNAATVQLSLPLGTHLFTLRVSDGTLDDSDQVQIVVQDTKPPTITKPADIQIGCSVDLLVPVAFQYSASDTCDPNPTVVATPASGSGFPVGTTVVTITANDHSGNASSATFNVVRAPLQFTGFHSPLGGADAIGGTLQDPLKACKLGSTIPIKFTLSCDGQAVTAGVHTLAVAKYSSETTSEAAIDATPQDSATMGNQFKLTEDQWHFNLDTKGTGMSAGTWLLTATLSDGSKHTAWIQLK